MTSTEQHLAVDRVREIVAGVLEIPVDEVDVDAAFYDELLVDSVQKLEIVVQVERAFKVEFDDEEAIGMHSVRDALALLEAKGAAGRG